MQKQCGETGATIDPNHRLGDHERLKHGHLQDWVPS
jgi:hypothetical protein